MSNEICLFCDLPVSRKPEKRHRTLCVDGWVISHAKCWAATKPGTVEKSAAQLGYVEAVRLRRALVKSQALGAIR